MFAIQRKDNDQYLRVDPTTNKTTWCIEINEAKRFAKADEAKKVAQNRLKFAKYPWHIRVVPVLNVAS